VPVVRNTNVGQKFMVEIPYRPLSMNLDGLVDVTS
jgi:hypothetical protein